jgi:hypothetical protein
MDELFCVDYNAPLLRARQPLPGTCSWIFRDETYMNWFASRRPSMLVLLGEAGTGKSVLTRGIMERILSGSDKYLGASFFCSHIDLAHNTEEAIVRSVLHQLVQLNPNCGKIVQNRLREKRDPPIVDLTKLWNAMRETLSMMTMDNVFIALDAVDELGPDVAQSFLAKLYSLVQNLRRHHSRSKLKVFVTCRPHLSLTTGADLTILSVDKKDYEQRHDINIFLVEAVETLAAHNSTFRAATTKQRRLDIVKTIESRANGVFLRAVQDWDEFRRDGLWAKEDIQVKLERLTATAGGIQENYDRSIGNLAGAVRDDAVIIFSILMAATRPLSEAELATIIGISRLTSGEVSVTTDIEPFPDVGAFVETWLSDMVSIGDDSRLTLVHASFRDYLTGWQAFRHKIASGPRVITRACLKYLRMRDLLRDIRNGQSSSGKSHSCLAAPTSTLSSFANLLANH